LKPGRKVPAGQRFVAVFALRVTVAGTRLCNSVLQRCDRPGRQFDLIAQKARSYRVSWELIRCQPIRPT